MEYIDRDDLLKAAWGKPTLSLSVYDIGNIKPVDVAPVRHGRWENGFIDTGDGPMPERAYLCSQCGKAQWRKSCYCPNCGAKMGSHMLERSLHNEQ